MTTKFGPSYYAGKTVFGVNSLGVLGSDVPAGGTNGPGLLREAVVANGWASSEVRLELTTLPVAGVLAVAEPTDASLVGAPTGIYFAVGNVYVGGALQGPLTFIFYNGVTALVLETETVKMGSVSSKAGIGGDDLKVYLSAGSQLVARKVPAAGDRLLVLQGGDHTATPPLF